MGWSPAMLDGFSMAALVAGQGPEVISSLSPRAAGEAEAHLLKAKARGPAALSKVFRRSATLAQLADASPRARAFLGMHAPAAVRAKAGARLAGLPAPRRGYRPPPGLDAALVAHRPRASTVAQQAQEVSEWHAEVASWPA